MHIHVSKKMGPYRWSSRQKKKKVINLWGTDRTKNLAFGCFISEESKQRWARVDVVNYKSKKSIYIGFLAWIPFL